MEIFGGGGCMIPAGGYIGRRVFHDGSGAAAAADPLPGVRACGCARVSRARLRKSGAGVCALVVGRSWFLKITREFQQEKSGNKKRRVLYRRS